MKNENEVEPQAQKHVSRTIKIIALLACSLLLHIICLFTPLTLYKFQPHIHQLPPKTQPWTVFTSLPSKSVMSLPPKKSKPLSMSVAPEEALQHVTLPAKGRAKLTARASIFGHGDLDEGVATGQGTVEQQALSVDAIKKAAVELLDIEEKAPVAIDVLDEEVSMKSAVEDTFSDEGGQDASSIDHNDAMAIAQRIEAIDRKQDLIDGYGASGLASIANQVPRQHSSKVHTALTPGKGGQARSGKRQNIIAMTKCFLDNFEENAAGNALIDRDGDENIAPSFEEEKYISYEAKINWCLQSSWKQHFERRCLAQFPRQKENVYVDFVVDQNGALVSCTLLQSSGVKEIDVAVMKNMQLAAPFPPLPKHFNTQVYRTGRRISIYRLPL